MVIDSTLATDSFSLFRKNLLERILKLTMTTDVKIRNEKVQYYIDRKAAKISTLLSSKIYKYE